MRNAVQQIQSGSGRVRGRESDAGIELDATITSTLGATIGQLEKMEIALVPLIYMIISHRGNQERSNEKIEYWGELNTGISSNVISHRGDQERSNEEIEYWGLGRVKYWD